MIDIIDFHTHRLDATRALISVDPRQFNPQPGKWYSVGYHPWQDLAALTEDDFALLDSCARHDQVLAIGETGMDTLRGSDLKTQAQVLLHHLQLAESLGKPTVIHSVRTAQNILTIRNKAGLNTVLLAIHGFRGNQHVAQLFLNAGCYLSYGPQFNSEALLATPLDRLLIETDDGHTPIGDVTSRIASVLGISPHDVETFAERNAGTLLNP